MQFRLARRTVALASFVAAAAAVQAQVPGWAPFVSVTPFYQGRADLDGGGDYSAWSTILRAGVMRNLGGGNLAGVVLNLDRTDPAFTSPNAFGGTAPWGVVQRYGIAAPLVFAVDGGWSLGLTPSFDWIHEDGADRGESLNWGAIVSATRRDGDGNRIGLGLGVFDRPGETGIFPVLIVDWKLSDRWRLTNPLPAGPTGPAGVEIDYRFDGGWNLGLGAAWRTTRLRLSQHGPVANGIGEERGAPVFMRATRDFGAGVTLNLYAGFVTAGKLRVEDASGSALREVDFDTAPLYGATLSARF